MSFAPYRSLDDCRMADSAKRLRTILKIAPNVRPLVESECNLMVRAVVRRFGTECVRQWLDQILEETLEDLTEVPNG